MKISKWFTYENGLLILLGFIFGIVFFDRNAVAVLTPFIVQDLGLTNTQLGLLGSGLALAWAISAYFISAWSDRRGSRKLFLIVAIVIFSLCSVFSGLAGSFLFLLIARVVMGLSEGPFLPICLSIMNVESSPKRRGINAGIMQNVFASLLGTTLAPIVLVFLAEQYDWRVAFFLTGIPGLICAVLVWKFVREPSSEEGVAQVVGDNNAAGTVQSELKAASEPKVTMGALQMLKEHNIRMCALIACCMVAWYLIGLTFLPIFFTEIREFEPSQMARVMAMVGISGLIAGVLVPGLSDRFGRKPIMIITCLVGVVAPLGALYSNDSFLLISIFIFVGFSAAGSFPIFMGVIPGETVPRKFAATAMGLIVCIGELIGGTGGPFIGGWIADQASLAAPILGMAGCAFCASLISLFLIETAPRKTGAALEA